MPDPQASLRVALADVILSAMCLGAYEARDFHGSTAVAPLKRKFAVPPSSRRSLFPRLNSRGPIEARETATRRPAGYAISTAQQPWPH